MKNWTDIFMLSEVRFQPAPTGYSLAIPILFSEQKRLRFPHLNPQT